MIELNTIFFVINMNDNFFILLEFYNTSENEIYWYFVKYNSHTNIQFFNFKQVKTS